MVVGVSTAVNALAWGVRSTFALFYVAMLGEFAWGRGPTALGYSLSWLGFVFFAPIAGWLSDRWGTRTVVAGRRGFLRVGPPPPRPAAPPPHTSPHPPPLASPRPSPPVP